MSLTTTVETLNLLGDESRMRLCALLGERELCVTDLVRATGISQSRVSTHLGRLREAGLVRDRRQGAQIFYGIASDALVQSSAGRTIKALLEDASKSNDPTLAGDRKRLSEIENERREGLPESVADELERYYSPGRSWRSLMAGVAALLDLGDVLDVGSGDGAAASSISPYCRTLTCIDVNARSIEAVQERFAKLPHVSARVADVHELPFTAASFDTVLLFHTLTYAERPARALEECARVLRPGGRLVLLCLDRHEQQEVTARYGERHPGFSPKSVRGLLRSAGLEVVSADVACRDGRKPHLQVVLAIADKPSHGPTRSDRPRRRGAT